MKGVDLRMGSNADVVSTETTVESEDAFLLGHLDKTIRHTLVRELAVSTTRLLLESGLDKVEGQTEEACEESSNGTGAQGLGLAGPLGALLELDLGLAEEGKLAKVQSHGTDDGGGSASPESCNTLVLGN